MKRRGSYFAIKEIWSPVQFEDRNLTPEFDGKLYLENRYLYTNLKECKFSWRMDKLELPNSMDEEITWGKCEAPDLEPRQKGHINIELPEDWLSYDVLYVKATDQYGQELYTWSWPISLPKDIIGEIKQEKTDAPKVRYSETETAFEIEAGDIQYSIGKTDGLLKKVVTPNGEIPFNNGPVICAGKTIFKDISAKMEQDTLRILCTFGKRIQNERIYLVFLSIRLDKA